jgi:DNA-binding PadR family transcriptional regulator
MDLKEYMRLKKQIEDKYQQEIHALELLWKNYGSKDNNSSETQRKNVAESAREVIKALGDTFSVTEVADGLKNLGHDEVSMPQLSNLLNRLKKRNEIVIVEEGKGRLPNTYRLAKAGELQKDEDFL